jgi:actin related protein 2/3 complex subunit 2
MQVQSQKHKVSILV